MFILTSENKNNIWWISLIIIAVVLVLAIIGIVFIIRKKREKKSEKDLDSKIEETTNSLSLAFGGRVNILSIDQKGSRVSLKIKDISKVDKEKIDSLFSPVMYMSDKITFVIGERSQLFEEMLKKKIDELK